MNKRLVFFWSIISGFAVIVLELFYPRLLALYWGSSSSVWGLVVLYSLCSLCVGPLWISFNVSKNGFYISSLISFLLLISQIFAPSIFEHLANNFGYFSSLNLALIFFYFPLLIPFGFIIPLFLELPQKPKAAHLILFSLGGSFFGGIYYFLFPWEQGAYYWPFLKLAFILLIGILLSFRSFAILLIPIALIFLPWKNFSLGREFTVNIEKRKNEYVFRIDGIIQNTLSYDFQKTDQYLLEIERVILQRNKAFPSFLFLGGGLQILPHRLGKKLTPHFSATIVDLEPQTFQAAGAIYPNRLKNKQEISQDPIWFMNKSDKKFDFIVVDLFNSMGQVPEHLISHRFSSLLYKHISSDGEIFLNIISTSQNRNLLKQWRVYLKTFFQFQQKISVLEFKDIFKQEVWVLRKKNFVSKKGRSPLVLHRLSTLKNFSWRSLARD